MKQKQHSGFAPSRTAAGHQTALGRLLLTTLLLLACIGGARAAIVTIGDGTSAQNFPLPGYWGYQYDVFLYTPSAARELGVNSDISSLAFNVAKNNASTGAEMYIWVKDVAPDYALAAATTFNEYITDATQVYANDKFTSTEGWNTFSFESTFSHEGGKALLVAVRAVGCSTSGGCSRSCYYTSATNTYWYKRQDNSDPGQEVSGDVVSNRANIQLDLTYTGSVCFTPTGLTYTNVIENAATLSWNESGSSTSWTLEYGTANDYAGATTVNVSGTPTTTLSGLAVSTTYYVRVKSDCGSNWLTGSFTTTAHAETVGNAWADDFEGTSCGWELINDTNTNAWAWGTATNNGGTHALYISNDGGTTNAYTMNSSAMVYATKLLTFADGKYEFSYDWNGNGESSYDYLRVALVPASVTLTAGTSTPSGFSTTGLPTGWIALDGGSKLNQVTAWQSTTTIINVTAGNYYMVLAWRNDTSTGTNPPAAVDNVSITKMACDQDVTDLAVSDVTTSSATLSWNGGEATQWQVAYGTDSNFEGATEEIVSTASYNMSGLQSSTIYYVKVRAYCGGEDFGTWSDVLSFATACVEINALGYTENFDSYTAGNNVLPMCWSDINTTTNSSFAAYPRVYANSISIINAHSAPNCLRLYSYAYNDPQPQYAILPEMTGLYGKQVTLMAKGLYSDCTFKIGTMSDPTDANTFQLITEQTLTTSYNEYSFIVNQQGNYLAIMIDAANESRHNNGVYIDDISIDNAPTCLKPSFPMLDTPTSITAHTATLKWTNGEEGQSAWQIAYSTSATFAPAADFTPGDGEGLVDADANPYTLNGLQANTTYYAYVRANCGVEDGVSEWSRIKATFTTTAANAAPTGLAVDASTITRNSATVTWTGVATNDLHESYEVYLSTEATMPEELVAANLITGITVNSYEFTGLAAGTLYYFWVRDNCGNDGLSAWSSHASFTTASSCQTPDGLAVANVTNKSATITWNTYGLTEFNLRYSTDGENWTVKGNVSNSCVINDLTANTTYQVQVQATCADAETWSTVLSFTTDCNAITELPWSENFDAYTGSTSSTPPNGYPNDELPNCWRFLNRSNSNSIYPQVFISSNSGYPVSGNCLFFKSSSSTPLYAVLPAFEENIAGLQLTFTYRNVGTSTSNGTLIVGYMTDPADATTFTTVLTCERTTTLTEKEVLFTNAPAGSFIAFKYQGGSYNNYYMSIDNVSVDHIPTCVKPTALECTATTTTTATLGWTNGADDQMAWQICLNGDETNLIMANSNPFTLEGLSASTAYTAKVRAYCSADDQSAWSNEVSFATECEAIVVSDSWSEDFEDGDMPTCWSQDGNGTWTVGIGDYKNDTGAHAGDKNAKILHSSNDNVTKLITPVLDLTSLVNPTLSFWYINRAWGGDKDGFAVYYRTASDADWTPIDATEEAHESWTKAEYQLPNRSATYQIAFEMTDGYGYGVGIDDISIDDSPLFMVYDNKDNSTEIEYRNKITADVALSGRTLWKDGYWNTLCLPFNLGDLNNTPLAEATLMELDVTNSWSLVNDKWSMVENGTNQTGLADDGTLYLYFKDTDEIIAGVPYIIKWVGDGTQNIENPTFMGVTINNVSLVDKAVSFQGGKFVGTYSYTQYNGEDKSILLLGGGNTLYWPQPGTDPNTGETVNPSIGAFRAYFQLDNPDAVRAFRLNFGDGEVQGITVTGYTDSADKGGAWYTINGMKLDKQPTRKGLYIKNGRKVVKK